MSTSELFNYIDSRINELTILEKATTNPDEIISFVARKVELWEMKEFIRDKEIVE